MSDDTETKTTTSKSPTHYAYHVKDGKGDGKGFWTRCGAAWMHRDGKGFNIQLDFVPLDGSIQLRIAGDKK